MKSTIKQSEIEKSLLIQKIQDSIKSLSIVKNNTESLRKDIESIKFVKIKDFIEAAISGFKSKTMKLEDEILNCQILIKERETNIKQTEHKLKIEQDLKSRYKNETDEKSKYIDVIKSGVQNLGCKEGLMRINKEIDMINKVLTQYKELFRKNECMWEKKMQEVVKEKIFLKNQVNAQKIEFDAQKDCYEDRIRALTKIMEEEQDVWDVFK